VADGKIRYKHIFGKEAIFDTKAAADIRRDNAYGLRRPLQEVR
jgi:hypothetical protein